MQNMVLAAGIGFSMLTVVLLVLKSRKRARGWTQLGLGLLIGALAAVVAVVAREDLIPDDVEVTLVAICVIAAGGLLTMLALNRR